MIKLIQKINDIIYLKKNEWPTFNVSHYLSIIIFAFLFSFIILSIYVLFYLLLINNNIQDLLIILILLSTRFVHRKFANEMYYFGSYSYFFAGFTLIIIFALLAEPYTIENSVIIGQNKFIIGKYAIEIKSIQEMGAMYGLVFIQAFDTLIALFTLLSTKENDIKYISILMLFLPLVFIVYTMAVTISITLL